MDKSAVNTIGNLLNMSLYTSIHQKMLGFLEVELIVNSPHEELTRYLIRAMSRWTETLYADSAHGRRIICFIDYTDDYPNWRDVLGKKPIREFREDSFGHIAVFEAQDGYAVLLDEFGAIFRSCEGVLLCLVDDKEKKRYLGGRCNVEVMAQIVVANCFLEAGYLIVHSGGVSRDGKCHLWTGKSGAGKSTRVLQLVEEGWDYCGDDILLLKKDNHAAWKVIPCSHTVRISRDSCAFFPQLSSLAKKEPEGDKHEFMINDFFITKVPNSTELERIFCLCAEGGIEPRRLSPLESFERLASGFLYYFWPYDANKTLSGVFEISSRVPTYLVSRDLKAPRLFEKQE